jgi:hypothetical protein
VKPRFRICAGPRFNGPAFLFLREPNDGSPPDYIRLRDKARFLFGSLVTEDVRSALARHILIVGKGQWETGLEPMTSSLGISTSMKMNNNGV